MNRFSISIVLCFCLAGAYVCGALLAQHDGGWSDVRADSSFLLRLCKSQTLPSASCADIVGSRWGSFDFTLGSRQFLVPTSFIGLIYFVAIGIWFALLGRIPATARWLWRATISVVACGLAGSLFFLGLMAFSLAQWCPPCVMAHLLNLAIFVSVLGLWRRTRHDALADIHKGVPAESGRHPGAMTAFVPARLAAWTVVAAIAAAIGLWMYFDSAGEVRRQWRKLTNARRVLRDMQNDEAFVLREYFAQRVVNIPARPVEPAGVLATPGDAEHNPDAAIDDASMPRLVIFTDYDCPGCACLEARRRELIDSKFSGQLRVEYRHIAIAPAGDPGRRPSDTEEAITQGTTASIAGEAARMQGDEAAFEQIRRLLFKSPRVHDRRTYQQLAVSAGLDVQRFVRDLDSDAVRWRVDAESEIARRLGVTATPALFLNGRRVPSLCVNSSVFWSAVAAEVTKRHVLTGYNTLQARGGL